MTGRPSICGIVRTTRPTTGTAEVARGLLPHVDRVIVAAHAHADRLAAAVPDIEVIELPSFVAQPERADGLVLSLAREDWVLWLADGEVVPAAILDELSALVADPDVVYYRFGDPDDEFRTRLFRNDPALVHASGERGSGPEAVGPHHLLRHARWLGAEGPPLPDVEGAVARRYHRPAVDAHWRTRPRRVSDYGAQLRLVDRIPTFSPGQRRFVFVAARNVGRAAWPGVNRPGPSIRIAYQWRTDPGRERVDVPNHGSWPKGEVPPGADVLIQALIEAPVDSGRYLLEIAMLHTWTWFGQSLTIPVAIAP